MVDSTEKSGKASIRRGGGVGREEMYSGGVGRGRMYPEGG